MGGPSQKTFTERPFHAVASELSRIHAEFAKQLEQEKEDKKALISLDPKLSPEDREVYDSLPDNPVERLNLIRRSTKNAS